jgi:hydroxymethylpyrimidine/phosphomethylpyrimidine kinase
VTSQPQHLSVCATVIESLDRCSPNAEEGLSLLSLPQPPTRTLIEQAANSFLHFGAHSVIVRSGALGAYIKSSKDVPGQWVEAYFTGNEANRVIDVTGAGNAFLGGLVAGLVVCHGNLLEGAFEIPHHCTSQAIQNLFLIVASLYATVSASYMIEQYGLPHLTGSSGSCSDTGADERWNGEVPHQRLEKLRARVVG